MRIYKEDVPIILALVGLAVGGFLLLVGGGGMLLSIILKVVGLKAGDMTPQELFDNSLRMCGIGGVIFLPSFIYTLYLMIKEAVC